MAKLLAFENKNRLEAGCDEAGRGCLAGPVVAAAVILAPRFKNQWLNDSKQLTEKRRNELRRIIESEAVSFAVSFVDHQKIDEINILNASFLAMHGAVDKLESKPEHLLIDGNRFRPYPGTSHSCIIKGDGKYLSIAAASILAKTYRDEFMIELHERFPHYDWKNNKGYPTENHRKAILEYGPTPFHRKSFTLLPAEQLSLF
ncbi:MAG: ribonuclease HII [Bacteroidota bacterium]|jgi:ribonuclease HII